MKWVLLSFAISLFAIGVQGDPEDSREAYTRGAALIAEMRWLKVKIATKEGGFIDTEARDELAAVITSLEQEIKVLKSRVLESDDNGALTQTKKRLKICEMQLRITQEQYDVTFNVALDLEKYKSCQQKLYSVLHAIGQDKENCIVHANEKLVDTSVSVDYGHMIYGDRYIDLRRAAEIFEYPNSKEPIHGGIETGIKEVKVATCGKCEAARLAFEKRHRSIRFEGLEKTPREE